LDRQVVLSAVLLTFESTGDMSATIIAMMAMTTSNSISVNAVTIECLMTRAIGGRGFIALFLFWVLRLDFGRGMTAAVFPNTAAAAIHVPQLTAPAAEP
jgi:hypothetical protein